MFSRICPKYEKRKMLNGKLRSKHILRQQEIERFLKCKFIRIIES